MKRTQPKRLCKEQHRIGENTTNPTEAVHFHMNRETEAQKNKEASKRRKYPVLEETVAIECEPPPKNPPRRSPRLSKQESNAIVPHLTETQVPIHIKEVCDETDDKERRGGSNRKCSSKKLLHNRLTKPTIKVEETPPLGILCNNKETGGNDTTMSENMKGVQAPESAKLLGVNTEQEMQISSGETVLLPPEKETILIDNVKENFPPMDTDKGDDDDQVFQSQLGLKDVDHLDLDKEEESVKFEANVLKTSEEATSCVHDLSALHNSDCKDGDDNSSVGMERYPTDYKEGNGTPSELVPEYFESECKESQGSEKTCENATGKFLETLNPSDKIGTPMVSPDRATNEDKFSADTAGMHENFSASNASSIDRSVVSEMLTEIDFDTSGNSLIMETAINPIIDPLHQALDIIEDVSSCENIIFIYNELKQEEVLQHPQFSSIQQVTAATSSMKKEEISSHDEAEMTMSDSEALSVPSLPQERGYHIVAENVAETSEVMLDSNGLHGKPVIGFHAAVKEATPRNYDVSNDISVSDLLCDTNDVMLQPMDSNGSNFCDDNMPIEPDKSYPHVHKMVSTEDAGTFGSDCDASDDLMTKSDFMDPKAQIVANDVMEEEGTKCEGKREESEFSEAAPKSNTRMLMQYDAFSDSGIEGVAAQDIQTMQPSFDPEQSITCLPRDWEFSNDE